MKREEVTGRMKELMSDSDRSALFAMPASCVDVGPPGQPELKRTDEECNLEKAEHTQFENWLNQRELFYDHQRMDKRTRNRKGIPDFIFGLNGLLICVEFKVAGRKLTPEQEHWRRRAMVNSKCQYYVFESAGDAINFFNGTDGSVHGLHPA